MFNFYYTVYGFGRISREKHFPYKAILFVYTIRLGDYKSRSIKKTKFYKYEYRHVVFFLSIWWVYFINFLTYVVDGTNLSPRTNSRAEATPVSIRPRREHREILLISTSYTNRKKECYATVFKSTFDFDFITYTIILFLIIGFPSACPPLDIISNNILKAFVSRRRRLMFESGERLGVF